MNLVQVGLESLRVRQLDVADAAMDQPLACVQLDVVCQVTLGGKTQLADM